MTDQPTSPDGNARPLPEAPATPRQRVLNDRYELGDVIGRGGMADVWLARDLLLSRDVAVKILRSDLARDPVFQARFRREAKSVAGLNDPSIVAVYDTGDTDVQPEGHGAPLKVPFIVMEYVSGHTLKDRLRSGPLGEQDAVNASLGVLAALAYSHKHGIVHRDIKPANVMITDGGSVKVMDFGIARAIADSAAGMTQTQAVVGTAQYLSPEQARGETVDARSDLYSAGCLLYELLTGRPPFVGDSPVSVAYQHVRETPQPASELNPAVTPALQSVLDRALDKDRELRFQSADDFADALTGALQGKATQAPARTAALAAVPAASAAPQTASTSVVPASDPTGFFQEADDRPAKRKSRAPLWIAGIALLVLLAVGGYFIYQWAAAERERNARITMPDVANLSVVDAHAKLDAVSLKYRDESVFDASVAKDHVVSSDPVGQTSVLKTTEVVLKVSKGPDAVKIPDDLTGKTDAAARSMLTALGLTVEADVDQANSATVPQGSVVKSAPEPGKEVKVGSSVRLTLSTGQVEVPELTGKKFDDMKKLIEGDEYKLHLQVTDEPTDDAEPGTIVEQDIPAASKVTPGSIIGVKVAVAPPTPSDTPTPSDDSASPPEDSSAPPDGQSPPPEGQSSPPPPETSTPEG